MVQLKDIRVGSTVMAQYGGTKARQGTVTDITVERDKSIVYYKMRGTKEYWASLDQVESVVIY
jgi:hypothetical protein